MSQLRFDFEAKADQPVKPEVKHRQLETLRLAWTVKVDLDRAQVIEMKGNELKHYNFDDQLVVLNAQWLAKLKSSVQTLVDLRDQHEREERGVLMLISEIMDQSGAPAFKERVEFDRPLGREDIYAPAVVQRDLAKKLEDSDPFLGDYDPEEVPF